MSTPRSRIRFAFALLLCAPLGGGCARDGEPSTADVAGKLTLTGSSTVAPLVLQIAKRFEEAYPYVRIDVQTGGSSRGIADVMSGMADIGMTSRDLLSGEAETLTAHAIARDGVSLILHASNPVTSLTDAEVRAIYMGDIPSWRDVGGSDTPITVVNKAAGRATLAVFMEYFGLEEKAIEADVVVGDNEQGIKTVAGNPDAIGYVSVGAAEYNSQSGVPIKLLSAGGVEATLANVRTGDFPIGRPLNLVTNGETGALALEFIDYCRSRDVRDLVTGLYFVPLETSN